MCVWVNSFLHSGQFTIQRGEGMFGKIQHSVYPIQYRKSSTSGTRLASHTHLEAARFPRQLVLCFVPCANKYPLACFFIVNHILSRPYLAKFAHTCFRFVEGWQCLDEMQMSIILHREDAKGRTQPKLRLGTNYQEGQWRDYRTEACLLSRP